MDEDIIPPTLDFEKPAAYAFVRHGMVRYKFNTGKKSYMSFALEEPLIDVQSPARPGKMETFLPDFTARYRYTDAWGHIQLSAFTGAVRFRPQTGSTENNFSFGFNLSGKLKSVKNDFFSYQFILGPGVARYRAGKYAAPDSDDQLKSIPAYGITASYKHYWNPKWSSLLLANYGKENTVSGQPETDLASAFYGALNLIWQFHPSAFAGIEYLHGGRENINEQSGRANRIQLSIQANINKHK